MKIKKFDMIESYISNFIIKKHEGYLMVLEYDINDSKLESKLNFYKNNYDDIYVIYNGLYNKMIKRYIGGELFSVQNINYVDSVFYTHNCKIKFYKITFKNDFDIEDEIIFYKKNQLIDFIKKNKLTRKMNYIVFDGSDYNIFNLNDKLLLKTDDLKELQFYVDNNKNAFNIPYVYINKVNDNDLQLIEDGF